MPCPFTIEMSNNVVAGALCSPHLLYAFIWYVRNDLTRSTG